MLLRRGVTFWRAEPLWVSMIASLALLTVLLGTPARAQVLAPAQRVTVHMVGCTDCAEGSPSLSIWDESQDASITPDVSQRGRDTLVLTLQPGYYRLFMRSATCTADRYLGVIPRHDRRYDVTFDCPDPSTPNKAVTIVRLVDGMRGLAGTLPPSVRAISFRDATGIDAGADGTVSGGAYYVDEARCAHCVASLRFGDGRTAHVAIDITGAKNFSLARRDIRPATLVEGLALHGSPYNAPETLVEGPQDSIWALDVLGNRVAVIPSVGHAREIDLPTPFAGANSIVATSSSVWVSEPNAGKLVRIRLDGSRVEFGLTTGKYHENLKLVRGPDGRVWYIDGGYVGVIDESGQSTTYESPAPLTTLNDIATGSDGRLWVVGEGWTGAKSLPFAATVDATGHWRSFPLADDAVSVLAGTGGAWVSGRYDGLDWVDVQGREMPAHLPVSAMRAKSYAIAGDNTLWFSDRYGNVIARATPGGATVATYTAFGPPGISDMRLDAEGDVWVAEPRAGAIEEYKKGFALPPAGVDPKNLLVASNGELWYSDPVADVVGVAGSHGRHSRCYAFRLSHIRHCGFGRSDLITTSAP